MSHTYDNTFKDILGANVHRALADLQGVPTILRTHRGYLLVYRLLSPPPKKTVVTVENYEKWYGLFLVSPKGDITEVPFPEDILPEETAVHFGISRSPYHDHVPNPIVVLAWARKMKFYLDPLAYEMMLGRWLTDEGMTTSFPPLIGLSINAKGQRTFPIPNEDGIPGIPDESE